MQHIDSGEVLHVVMKSWMCLRVTWDFTSAQDDIPDVTINLNPRSLGERPVP